MLQYIYITSDDVHSSFTLTDIRRARVIVLLFSSKSVHILLRCVHMKITRRAANVLFTIMKLREIIYFLFNCRF